MCTAVAESLGTMRTPQVRTIAFFALGLGVLLVTLALTGGPPPVTLTVRGFSTNSWRAKSDGSREYVVCAIVELTNASDRPVSYLGNRDPVFADYTLLYPTSTGWKSPAPPVVDGLVVHRLGWWPYTLAPSHSITFE